MLWILVCVDPEVSNSASSVVTRPVQQSTMSCIHDRFVLGWDTTADWRKVGSLHFHGSQPWLLIKPNFYRATSRNLDGFDAISCITCNNDAFTRPTHFDNQIKTRLYLTIND